MDTTSTGYFEMISFFCSLWFRFCTTLTARTSRYTGYLRPQAFTKNHIEIVRIYTRISQVRVCVGSFRPSIADRKTISLSNKEEWTRTPTKDWNNTGICLPRRCRHTQHELCVVRSDVNTQLSAEHSAIVRADETCKFPTSNGARRAHAAPSSCWYVACIRLHPCLFNPTAFISLVQQQNASPRAVISR